jgi:hypothetical protein
MSHLGEVVSLPGGGEITLVPNSDGDVYFSVTNHGLSVRFTVPRDSVVELREALAFSWVAGRSAT